MLTTHLKRHWHHHLALWFSLLCAALLLTSASAVTIYRHLHGGFRPGGPMPPAIRITGGPPLPPAVSLAPFIVRVHNQGNSSSCVGQTLATIEEIIHAERTARDHARRAPRGTRARVSFSAGFIYDQVNGGVDNGTTYDAAFSVLLREGDATLAAFPHDGQDWYVTPTAAARANAAHFRFRSWRSIAVTDTHTIKAELHAGRPLALAIPVYDTVYSHFNTPLPVFSDAGSFHFWHSLTVIGYSPTGVQILNSWGPDYGQNGVTTFAWSFLAHSGGIMAISMPSPRRWAVPDRRGRSYPGRTRRHTSSRKPGSRGSGHHTGRISPAGGTIPTTPLAFTS